MKTLLASALTLVSGSAFAATLAKLEATYSAPLMDNPLTVLLVTLAVLGLGYHILHSRRES